MSHIALGAFLEEEKKRLIREGKNRGLLPGIEVLIPIEMWREDFDWDDIHRD